MTVPIAHPVGLSYTMKTATAIFTLEGAAAGDDFSDHIGEVTLTPSPQSGAWTSINGKVIQDVGIATWAAQFGLVQDLEENGFLRWLLEHEGEKAAVDLTLASGADPVSFGVTISPSTIGGAVASEPLTGTVSMPVDGRPEFGTAAPLAADVNDGDAEPAPEPPY